MPTDRLDPILDALRHPLRRAAVRGLIEAYLPLPVPSFATYLALSVFPDAETNEFNAFRETIQCQLHHAHLPKLAEAGIITYDPDVGDGVIDKGPQFEAAQAFVAVAEDMG